MNGAKLTAADTVIDSPTVNLVLNDSLRVMAGGLVQGKWINISAGHVEVEASGIINAEKRGHAAKSGPGISSGKLARVVYHLGILSFVCCPYFIYHSSRQNKDASIRCLFFCISFDLFSAFAFIKVRLHPLN